MDDLKRKKLQEIMASYQPEDMQYLDKDVMEESSDARTQNFLANILEAGSSLMTSDVPSYKTDSSFYQRIGDQANANESKGRKLEAIKKYQDAYSAQKAQEAQEKALAQEEENKRRYEKNKAFEREKFEFEKTKQPKETNVYDMQTDANGQVWRINKRTGEVTKVEGAVMAPKDTKISPYESELQKQEAQKAVEWETSGRASYNKNKQKLSEALSTLQKGNFGTTGNIVGRLPDIMRTEEAVATEEAVRSAVQGMVKAVLGAQFTQKEGEDIMKRAYNPTLSPEENMKRIQAEIDQLETIAQANEGIANKHSGKPSQPQSTQRSERKTIERKDPKTGKIVIYDAETKQPLGWK